tara:strand:- start:386 stop:625 length:240 start_codon:yes stop_codon:yes gene_type:complete
MGQEEGFRFGICKGLLSLIFRELAYSTFRIGLYSPIKVRLLGETDPKTTPFWKRFLAGALAGGIGSMIAQPVDLVKTRA